MVCWAESQEGVFIRMINFNLSEEQILIQKTAKEFAKNELSEGAIHRDEQKIWPTEQIKKMADLGFLGMMANQQWNGGGMDTISYAIAMEEISAVDASAAVVMSVNNSLVCYLIEHFGDEFQKEKYLKELTVGKKLGAFSLSEPQSGSDASNMLTTAVRDGDDYIINGTKNWVTNGINSDIVLVFAMTEKGIGHKGISCFIVEKEFNGFECGKPEDKLGIRSSDTCELYFDNVRVPKENLIGEEGKGWTYAKYLLEFERGNGYSSELYQQLQQLKTKASIEDIGGTKLSEDPNFMEAIAKLEVQINAMEATELRILGSLAAGQNVGPESSLLKTRGTEIGQAITELAVELVGYYGIPFHNPGPEIGINEPAIGSKFANTAAPRYFNYRKASIYAGSNEIQRNIMAKLVLGL